VLPQFDYDPPEYTGPSIEEMKGMREKYLNPTCFMFYQKPIMVVDGKMQYLFD